MRSQPIALREHRWSRGVELTPAERAALLRVRDLVVVPTAVDGAYDVRPGSTIGSLSVDGRTILIRPKIGFERALFLVSYAIDRAAWNDDVVEQIRSTSIVDAIAAAFARMASRALRGGPIQGYRPTEDSLHTVRGRIRVADQLRIRLGLVPPIEVAFDEFTVDVTENRLLRAALHAVRRSGLRSTRVSEALREVDARLEDVALVEYDTRALPRVVYTRLNAHYRPALELAAVILRSSSYELHAGDVRTSSFLIEMNRTFEDFVVVALREALGVGPDVFRQGVKGRLWLDFDQNVELRPDLSWWSGDTCMFVGDAKYKRTELDGESADLYQLLAYVVATGLSEGLLVYAAGEGEPAIHVIDPLGKRLHVRKLELRGKPAEVLAEIDGLAREVRRMQSTMRSEYAA